MERSRRQVDTHGLELRSKMAAISREALSEVMGTGELLGKDREHEEEHAAQDWTPTKGADKGKSQERKLKRGARRDDHRSLEQGVTKRSELYATSRQPAGGQQSGVGRGKLRAVSEGMWLGLRGDCPVTGHWGGTERSRRKSPLSPLITHRLASIAHDTHLLKAIPSFTKLSSLPFHLRDSTVWPWYLWVIVTSFWGYQRRRKVVSYP